MLYIMWQQLLALPLISTLYFAATELTASNLINENKNHSNIFITGNIVVDSLQLTLEKTSPSKYVQLLSLIKNMQELFWKN